ncbi:hypothetical protein [Photobacterium leiognathi]|uniref:hypothetical protein n=1 Tax=Photobacterium leiognathi TaxID=553611 RepID=UPI002981FA08|nr:hypothetical protein [Photobacterium leiognathi]
MKEIDVYEIHLEHKYLVGKTKYVMQEGQVGLPPHYTDIEPPLICRSGYIPMFKDGKWSIVEDNFNRPNITEWSYFSGRTNSTYKPIVLSVIGGDFPNFKPLSNIGGGDTFLFSICNKIRFVQGKYGKLLQKYNDIMLNPLIGAPVDGPKEHLSDYSCNASQFYEYHFLAEEVVALIRSVIDTLIQFTYILTNYDDYEKNETIVQDCIGKVLKHKNKPETEFEKILVGNGTLYIVDKSNYLEKINSLSNALKHSYCNMNTYSKIGEEEPTITGYYTTRNNHKKEIIFNNYSATQIMIGFQDTILRILKNQKAYESIKEYKYNMPEKINCS